MLVKQFAARRFLHRNIETSPPQNKSTLFRLEAFVSL